MGALDYYVLIGHTPIAVDMFTWGHWLVTANRQVAWDEIPDAQVSTVFLGLDHNFYNNGPPILFETMIFGGPLDGEQWRYATWKEAERGHAAALAKAKKAADQVAKIAKEAGANHKA